MSETTQNAAEAIQASGMQQRSFWAAMDKREVPHTRGDHGACVWDIDELRRLRLATCKVSFEEALSRVKGRTEKTLRPRGWLSRLWRRS